MSTPSRTSPTPPDTFAAATFTTWHSVLTLSAPSRRDCRDIHRLHQFALYGHRPPHLRTAVPTPPPPHVLFVARRSPATRRADAGTPTQLLVQSPTKPDWQPLLTTQRLSYAQVTPVRQHYRAGDHVDIHMTANPSQRESRSPRRVALNTPEECGAWLQRHLKRNGILSELSQMQVGPKQTLTGTSSTGRTITIVARYLRARGTVQNAAAFAQALTNGLGPAKPYGCGLLLTQPPTPDPLS
ncbi:type I-E CRISPR-associated protein Cas6/Cse3/CasE [Streptomyces scopuliridis]|uniref:Type I-E CRISPR-associated protein Cas6/Cse3/CasE n=1 Tax=Streptomyces scopuliridis TaxID=452529 RepID=A0ACD4ZTG5_9ACTN|nr:type I-E CRISPR-associated protein Cas6/Cse3/CasE [Streptomyces scopuliridis]WSC01694.1 type I-E CRISPR-associated protein Cas6/Cse3/CasE [Streptomyces scopuliridis]WSC04767.1 type I-E CRISPR-associated protein Cas6/Cse3/CasE [Streptomyces scopuliridis]